MWSILIVPSNVAQQFILEWCNGLWHEHSPRAFVLERQNESLHNGDRAMLSDCTKSRFDASGLAPELIVVSELRPLVTDDVFRSFARKAGGGTGMAEVRCASQHRSLQSARGPRDSGIKLGPLASRSLGNRSMSALEQPRYQQKANTHAVVSVETYRNDPLYPRIVWAVGAILARGKVVAPVDVLVGMGLLDPTRLEAGASVKCPISRE